MSIVLSRRPVEDSAVWQAIKECGVKIRDWFWLVVVAVLLITWLIYVAPVTLPTFVHGM